MIESQGRVATSTAEAMLERLCKHFAKKIPVVKEDQWGCASFPFGECELAATGDMLIFTCRSPDMEALMRLREVIELHVGMFSRRAPLRMDWR